MKRNSVQRETILNSLCGTTCHPTAAWVYDKVRSELPNISLGTVYRNLSNLRDDGTIITVNVGDGVEHFDAVTLPHGHFSCVKCKQVIDIDFCINKNQINQLELENEVKITENKSIFFGLCSCCNS